MPTILEDMEVPPDQVDMMGNWTSNKWCETYTVKILKLAVVTLAGFAVSETYSVSWASVNVLEELQMKVFLSLRRL
ncbi:uncharacterized protein ARMOST_08592 [Armillaria ostoyae]|uniref:Uncharacterized protein n=1 Tax=Armillaria ostoyae TaxID=47428 RepID=A0A284R940_ARMOS|nr:uncharacterized protein ARMOST_08592 [Armillaria ostoyae]